MAVTALKLLDEDTPQAPASSAVAVVDVPAGFVPATKAQVAYWRQLCGVVSAHGKAGVGDTDWPSALAPNRFTLRELEARRILVRRSRAWHLRRGWLSVLSLLRQTAVDSPPLLPAERPGPKLPTFAELETWDKVCRWLDVQPSMRARLPILNVPDVGAVSGEMLRGMRMYRLVRHGSDCTWRLSRTWKARLSALWQGILKAEGERQPAPTDAPAPYSVAAGIDTWYLNRIDKEGMPPGLRVALDRLQAKAKDEDDEVETPWSYDGVPLIMYRAGVNTRQGGGVSWSYILRNPSLTLLIRKTPLGGIIAQARLGSECLWRLTPLAALNALDEVVRLLWLWHDDLKERLRHVVQIAEHDLSGHWQVSQVHIAHDVAHAPLEVEQVNRYVSRSRKNSVFNAAREEVAKLYTAIDDPLDALFADEDDLLLGGGLDWDTFYADGQGDDGFDVFDPFGQESNSAAHEAAARRAIEEPEPVEERASSLHRWGRRLSGVTWSPGGAVSFVAYDKVLEGRLRGKSHMPPIWKANGWDGVAPVTRHEARLRRDALHALLLAEHLHLAQDSQAADETQEPDAEHAHAELDDPWRMLEHQQDIFAYVVGCPTATDAAIECPTPVDVAWLRRVAPDPNEKNPSRWPTDPVWAVVQAPRFTDAPVEVRRLIRREVRSQQIAKRDRGAYGLVVSRTALAFSNPKHWDLSYAIHALYRVFEDESQKPGKDFAELVRSRRRALGLPVPSEGRVVPFRSQPEPVLPNSEIDQDDSEADTDADDTASGADERTPDVHRLALLRTERRLDELDIAIDVAVHATQTSPTPANRRRVRDLERAYEHELQVHEAIRCQIDTTDTE